MNQSMEYNQPYILRILVSHACTQWKIHNNTLFEYVDVLVDLCMYNESQHYSIREEDRIGLFSVFLRPMRR